MLPMSDIEWKWSLQWFSGNFI